MTWRIGVDTGGTFTDIVAINEQTGERHVHKTSSTPSDPSEAFSTGMRDVLAEIGCMSDEVRFISHGTTVATNAILEAKYSRMGLIVTAGYREMLECARQTVPGDFGDITWWIKPPRVVPLELVREIPGRLNYAGEEIESLDEDDVYEVAREFRLIGVDAIAVSLIHSYRDAAHEQRVREIIKDVYPECYVSISSDVIREYREYERTLSTCLNTGLMPLCSAYIAKLNMRLRQDGHNARLYMMKSSGGIVDAAEIVPQPIAAVLSGPAAGVVTASHYATLAGSDDVITIDIGGTSTDICLIDRGTPHMLTEGRIDIFDIKTPMIDMHTVGAGGGSIAWLSGGRSLRVGPNSAGASPGPVCYAQGGEEPTLTDAYLVLGRISSYLLGGEIALDREAAQDAIEGKIARPLGMSVAGAASGVVDIATTNIAQGINVVSVKRGRDPRDYALMAFGGAGGLNACLLAEAIGAPKVIVPPAPGVTSAEGLLFTDVRFDHVVTDVQREDRLDFPRLAREYSSVCAAVLEQLRGEGFPAEQTRLSGFADMRYAGQAYELRVPMIVDGVGLCEMTLRQAIAHFHRLHDDRYGYAYEGQEAVEVVNIGVTGLGLFDRPVAAEDVRSNHTWADAQSDVRQAYFGGTNGYVECPVYDRSRAPRADLLKGPAVIEQYDATLVIDPGWVASVDRVGQITIVRSET